MTNIGYSDYFPDSQFQMHCLACLGKILPNDYFWALSRGSHKIRYAVYNHRMLIIYKHLQRVILKHPVCESFLHMKWLLVKRIFDMYIFSYVIFLVSLSLLVFIQYSPSFSGKLRLFISYHHPAYNAHYSTFFGATVLREVLDICPYSSLLVVATKKQGIMAIC